MAEQAFHSISQVARTLGLPISTVRYYRDNFSAFIPTVGEGRRRLYPFEAVELIRLIHDSYAAGLDRQAIQRELESQHDSATSRGTAVQVHQVPPSREYQDLVTSLLEGERERRDLLWQMVREISRFGQAIEQQHFVLNELVEHLVQRPERQLPPAHTISQPGRDESGRSDSDELRRALASEKELVERLRRSKLELERRAAAAEAELDAQQSRQRGIWNRLFRAEEED